jgi:4a-hydroxytetrahydrobiopterin dehydratase
VQVAIDALVIPDVLPFWRAVLGYEQVGAADLIDPNLQGPPFWFQQMDAARLQRNRIHIDVYVPVDQAEARVAAALAAGGHLVSDENAPEWWTLRRGGQRGRRRPVAGPRLMRSGGAAARHQIGRSVTMTRH